MAPMQTVGPVGGAGRGYVGLPLAVAFAEAGVRVTGLDTNEGTVAAINRGESHIEDVSSASLEAVGDRLAATTNPAALRDVDAIVLCVPTPLSEHREPDLGPLL